MTILELRDMKHDGSHSLIVRLGDSERRSDFIDGYGAFKVIKFTTNFPITHSDSLNSSFWSDRLLHVSVTHKRTFFNDKVVGCCAIPIVRARGAEYTAWYSLLHKGSPRGSVKVRIDSKSTTPPAASFTNLPATRSARFYSNLI